MTLKYWAGGSTITYLQNPSSSFWIWRILKGAQYYSCGTLCLTNNAHARKTCVSLKPTHVRIFSRYYKGSSFFITKITLCSNSKSTAERKKNVSQRQNEGRRISALLRPVDGQYQAKSAEMRRSSFSRRDTSFFIQAPRYVLLPLNHRNTGHAQALLNFRITRLSHLQS